MPTLLSFHDQQHLTRMFVQEQRVNVLFNRFVSLIAPEMRKWKDSGNKNSVWVRNPGIEKAIDKYLVQFQSELEKLIKSGQSEAWKEAILKNDKMVEKYIKGMSLSSIVKEGLFKRNLDALEILQNRTENGLNLSKRVWNIADQTKGHVELFLESGIASGRSADAISRDFRQMLEKPDKRFRRVRDKNGKLVYSQPMKEYTPGRGVYRSSKMNAIRVSATETNMGYRMSDCERWNQLDFVLGFEVKRSRNGHPCSVCDAMVGKYPKDFVFSAWHPFCICIAVPIVMNHEDFADYLLTDQIPADKYIREIPSNAKEWINDYSKKHPDTPPLFVKQNDAFFKKGAKVEPKKIEIKSSSLTEIQKHMETFDVSDSQKQAISEYTGGRYAQINSYLRGIRKDVPDSVKNTIFELDGFLKGAPKYETTTFRGMTVDESVFADFKNLKKGDFFIEKGFLSTSMDKSVSTNFAGNAQYQIEMTIKGKNGVLIETLSDAKREKEVLFNRESVFTLESIKIKQKGVTGKILITLTEM